MSGAEVMVGQFEVLGPQSRGNLGEVYRARDLQTGETVAVTVSQDPLRWRDVPRQIGRRSLRRSLWR